MPVVDDGLLELTLDEEIEPFPELSEELVLEASEELLLEASDVLPDESEAAADESAIELSIDDVAEEIVPVEPEAAQPMKFLSKPQSRKYRCPMR